MVQRKYSGEPPLNREPPIKELISSTLALLLCKGFATRLYRLPSRSFITTGGAYNRNHSAIPVLDAATHIITVGGDVETSLKLSVAQLKDDFPQHEVICALQCAGNRRHTMRTKLKEVVGIDWLDGAVMNCIWKGPRLRDILLRAGLKEKNPAQSSSHVAFACFQAQCEDDDWYGGSIELWRAMRIDEEVILALEMNGEPLSPCYGFPVRVVVPGVAGARWVKWLDRITVQRRESSNFYQQHDYKILPPEAVSWEVAEQYWDKAPAIQCMPVNSIVAVPDDNETVQLDSQGLVEVKGYAVPQGNQGPVTRVEVSGDDGKTWVDAELEATEVKSKWCWTLWKASVEMEKGSGRTIFSRATDAGGNTQSKFSEWNLRGVGYSGYGASWNLTVI